MVMDFSVPVGAVGHLGSLLCCRCRLQLGEGLWLPDVRQHFVKWLEQGETLAMKTFLADTPSMPALAGSQLSQLTLQRNCLPFGEFPDTAHTLKCWLLAWFFIRAAQQKELPQPSLRARAPSHSITPFKMWVSLLLPDSLFYLHGGFFQQVSRNGNSWRNWMLCFIDWENLLYCNISTHCLLWSPSTVIKAVSEGW